MKRARFMLRRAFVGFHQSLDVSCTLSRTFRPKQTLLVALGPKSRLSDLSRVPSNILGYLGTIGRSAASSTALSILDNLEMSKIMRTVSSLDADILVGYFR